MKKVFTFVLVMAFFLTVFADPVLAGRKYDHGGGHGRSQGGYSYHGHSGHGGHNHINGWEAAAIGLGAAVIGGAIISSFPREQVTVVERNTYYQPAPPPPPCREYAYDCPRPCDPPPRVWVPSYYEHVGGGYYRRVPGHWE